MEQNQNPSSTTADKSLKGAAAKPAPAPAKTPDELKKIFDAWRFDLVNNQVNRKSAALAEQTNAALDELADPFHDLGPQVSPEKFATALDTWFENHFKTPPISHDTDFYNALHAAKEDLKARLSA
jgi:hypothetical protein